MDEQEAFANYFEHQHTRNFPRRGTTGTQMREALAAFRAGIAYATHIRPLSADVEVGGHS